MWVEMKHDIGKKKFFNYTVLTANTVIWNQGKDKCIIKSIEE